MDSLTKYKQWRYAFLMWSIAASVIAGEMIKPAPENVPLPEYAEKDLIAYNELTQILKSS